MAEASEQETLLARMLEAGRAAWPGVDLEAQAFERHVHACAAGPGEMGALRGPDLYLACACARGDARAIAILDERYLAGVAGVLATRERSAATIDEVRQLVRARLLVGASGKAPKIAEFSGRGALEAWVRVVVVRTYENLRRQRRDHEEIDEERVPDRLAGADPELLLMQARYQAAFDAALRDAFTGLPARDRALFRLQFRRGLSLDQIALVYQVHRATVARWIGAARDRLLEATTDLLRSRLKLSAAELASLMGVLGSKLDVSIEGLLRESGEQGAG